MKINHIALWTKDLEKSKAFYETYFGAIAGNKYSNQVKQFTSYFLSFPDSDCRLEIMTVPFLNQADSDYDTIGLAHFAISVGSAENVNQIVERLRIDKFKIISEPRTTGEGYYESVVCGPDGNNIEITI
jgi:lactoylglutathione lyase